MTAGKLKICAAFATASLLAAGSGAFARDGARPRGVNAQRESATHTRTTERTRTESGRARTRRVDTVTTRTDDGFERTTTVTNAQGETATRSLDVSRNAETGTTTRAATHAGKERSMTDVIQRTEDGFTRVTTRTSPSGETHTRSVEVSCNPDAVKCVKEVEVDRQN